MSFHPNDLVRRSRAAVVLVSLVLLYLLGGFFRTQIIQHDQYALQSEENRLRQLPLPAPRGIIYDIKGRPIAENVVGYSVSVLGVSADSLRATMRRLSAVVPITDGDIETAIRRFRRDGPTRPTVILSDASFDVISVLEEHRTDLPGLIIQSSPKRHYPDSTAVSAFVGYTGEINESELLQPRYANAGYKQGQQIGKQGLEKQYEQSLRGSEGSRFVEVDARGRVVREVGTARPDLMPKAGDALYTTIDVDLQKFADSLFKIDSVPGGVVALEPKSGAVLALYSGPGFDPNRFIGGIPAGYWKELRENPLRPLYNKALQGQYPPGSTWKLITSVTGLEAGVVDMHTRMPIPCTGGMQYGARYFRCWDKNGHGHPDLFEAIKTSCDVYFYQLGLKIGLARMLAGGVALGGSTKTGIDLPEEGRPRWPQDIEYYNRRFGPRNWANSGEILNLSIGQGANTQTILSMAKFYTALATDGSASTPHIARLKNPPPREKIIKLPPDQVEQLRQAMAAVLASGGTAAGSRVEGLTIAGKTGTAQSERSDANGKELNHAWFAGFAPVENPKIVIVVMMEYVPFHGSQAARYGSALMARYLGVRAPIMLNTGG